MDGLLRVKDVCDILQINRNTLYDLIDTGLLVAIDLKKGLAQRPRYRIKKSSLNTYMQQQTITPPRQVN